MSNRFSLVLLVASCALALSGCPTTPTPPTVDGGPPTDTAPTDSGPRLDARDGAPPVDGGPVDVCGDGTLASTGETCDDGNTAAGDGCDASCATEAGWTCDDAEPSACAETCGDGTVVGAEAGATGCDDGGTATGDGCDAACVVEAGWSCAGAPSVCTPGCGDGVVVGSEGCDDGASANDDGCSSACQIETGFTCTGAPSACASTCGDGTLASDEGCDDGGTTSGDGCDDACVVEAGWDCSTGTCATVCGDGVIVGAETCDDGDASAGDGCSDACAPETGFTCTGAPSTCASTCGDGTLASDEQCDDANTATRDGCGATCRIEAGWDCSTGTCAPVCGDGLVVVGRETCDDGNVVSEPCAYGLTSCTVCAADCANRAGVTSFCGDGATDAAEEACDDGDTTTETRCAYGTASCTRCDATCDAALSLTGNVCADGVRDPANETCDDGNLTPGDGCDATCRREPLCGDGFVDAPEVCDDGNVVAADGCEADCLAISDNFEVEPNDVFGDASAIALGAFGRGTIGVPGDVDFWEFTLTSPADVRIETFDATGAACAVIDTVVDLFDTDGTTLLATDDEGSTLPGHCSLIDPTTVVAVQNLPAGTYYVSVREFRATDTGSYSLRITLLPPPVCGDGLLGRGQACDDGNVASGDGCSATCTVEPTYTCAGAPSVCTVAYELIAAACIDTTAGTLIADVTTDDDASAIAALPFSFAFYGTTATHYSVTSNGYMQLYPSATGTPSTGYQNVAIPATGAPNDPDGFVAAFWDDLVPGTTGSARTITVGAAGSRRFVVEWRRWEIFSGIAGTELTFQAHLLEATGRVELHYCSMTAPSGTRHTGDSATIGAENATGTAGLNISFDTTGAVATGRGFRFAP